MDLIGEMLASELERTQSRFVDVSRIAMPIERHARSIPVLKRFNAAFSVDRLVHRFWQYPSQAKKLRNNFDVFHIVDHSYSALAHALPSERTLITCHDIDAFSSILGPKPEPRSAPFRAMTRRIATGLRRAARIICVSQATERDLLASGLVEPGRTTVIPNGVHPA